MVKVGSGVATRRGLFWGGSRGMNSTATFESSRRDCQVARTSVFSWDGLAAATFTIGFLYLLMYADK